MNSSGHCWAQTRSPEGDPNSAVDLLLGIALDLWTEAVATGEKRSDCSPPVVIGEPGVAGDGAASRRFARLAADSFWGASIVTAKVEEKAVERRNRCPLRAAAAAAAVAGARQAPGLAAATGSDSARMSADGGRKLPLWARLERSEVTLPDMDIAAAETMAARRNGELLPRWTPSNCSPAHTQHSDLCQSSTWLQVEADNERGTLQQQCLLLSHSFRKTNGFFFAIQVCNKLAGKSCSSLQCC